MNMEEKIDTNRKNAALTKKLRPSGFITVDSACGIKNGDKITMAGIKRHKNGLIETSCKEGEETIWIAKVIK